MRSTKLDLVDPTTSPTINQTTPPAAAAPVPPVAPVLQSPQPAAVSSPQPENVSGGNKKVFLILGIFFLILVLAGLGTGGFFLYQKNFKSDSTNSSPPPVVEEKSMEEIVREESGFSAPEAPQPSSEPTVGQKEIPQSANQYVNSQLGFSFEGPDGWLKQESQDGYLVAYQSTQTEKAPNNLDMHATFNVTVDEIPKTENLDTYAKAGNAQRALIFQDYNLISSTKTTLGGEPAYIDDFTVKAGSVSLKMRQVYALRSKKGFILTFGAYPPSWDKYDTIFESVRQSFSFTGIVSGIRIGF